MTGSPPDPFVKAERTWRAQAWATLAAEGTTDIAPARLRELGVSGGAQGIWVNKARTGHLVADGAGVAVAVLQVGKSLPDDLTEEGLIYHYQVTEPGSRREAGEIEALKWAHRLQLPVFVVTRSATSSERRTVHLGWVELWNDEQMSFLVTFSETSPPAAPPADELPFFLTATTEERRTLRKIRRGELRFRFEVLQRYGAACALCDLGVRELLQATHLGPVDNAGANDPRNGLPLCVLHRSAHDRGLWAIEPKSLRVVTRPDGPSARDLRISRVNLDTLRARPHAAALDYAWDRRSFR